MAEEKPFFTGDELKKRQYAFGISLRI